MTAVGLAAVLGAGVVAADRGKVSWFPKRMKTGEHKAKVVYQRRNRVQSPGTPVSLALMLPLL